MDPVPFVVVTGTAFGGCYAFFPVYFLSFGLSAAAALVGTTAIFLALAAIAYVRLVRNARPEIAAELPPGRRLEQIFYHALVGSGEWATLWPLFGGANQTLAALALLSATLWLANWDESKQLVSTGVPMALMLAVTVTALLWIGLYRAPTDALDAADTATAVSAGIQAVIALVLAGLALALAWMGYKNITAARDSYTGAVTSDD